MEPQPHPPRQRSPKRDPTARRDDARRVIATMREPHLSQLNLVEELSSLRPVACPDCGSTAEVEWQSTLNSTQGLVVLMKIPCLNRHWFLMPRDSLVTAS
jgi:hypothetical protein